MKIKQLILIAFVLSSGVVKAEISFAEDYPADKTTSWNFEIKNKDKKILEVTIQNGNRVIAKQMYMDESKGKKEAQHGYLRISGLNLGLPVIITLREFSEETGGYKNRKAYAIPVLGQNKTIFVTYEKGKLRTQSGKGWFDKETQSGLSLANNVNDSDIEQLSDEDATSNMKEVVKRYNQQQKPEAKRAEKLQELFKRIPTMTGQQLIEAKREAILMRQNPMYHEQANDLLKAIDVRLERLSITGR